MLFNTKEEVNQFIFDLTRGMMVSDVDIENGVEIKIFTKADQEIKIITAPPGTVFDQEIIESLNEKDETVSLIFGNLDNYTMERIVIVDDFVGNDSISDEYVDDDILVIDPDLEP